MSVKEEEAFFEAHENLVLTAIKRQAGTLSKAILEGIMNSIDAGASKCVIKITQTRFEIDDDGRGFDSKDEVRKHFGTFGEPHQESEGDKTYGQFRMGRGQLMAFAKTVYRTNEFEMTADVKNRGRAYNIKSGLKKRSGCLIKGTLYNRLSASEHYETLRELRDLAAYAQIPIWLNGDQINKVPHEQEWDLETEDAYFKFRQMGPVRVYNLGVMVREYPPSSVPAPSCIVVSKKQLVLNSARNDIITHECETWKRIKKTLRGQADVERKKNERLTDDQRRSIVRDLVCGDKQYSDLSNREKRLIKVGTRQYSTLERLLRLKYENLPITWAPHSYSSLSDRLHSSGTCFVINPATLAIFDVETIGEFVALFTRIVEQDRRLRLYEKRLEFSAFEASEVGEEPPEIGQIDLPTPSRMKKSHKSNNASTPAHCSLGI